MKMNIACILPDPACAGVLVRFEMIACVLVGSCVLLLVS